MTPALRASTADREQVVTVLGQHTAAGRLTLSEYDDRARAAYAAATVADLDRLLADLPAIPVVDSATRAPCRGWLLTAAICLAIWVATSLAHGTPLGFWPAWVIGPWGAVIVGKHLATRHGRARMGA